MQPHRHRTRPHPVRPLHHHRQGLPDARPLITISIEPSGSVTAKGSSDDLSATLLRTAGFRQTEDWYGRRHRLPTTTAPADRAAIATHATEMLRAARYSVDLDPKLDLNRLTTPTDPNGLKVTGQQVLQLSDRIRGAATPAQAAEVIDQLLDPDDGILARVREALEAAAEQVTNLDPNEYELSDRFSTAAERVGTAEAELVDAVGDLRSLGAPPDARELARQEPTAAVYPSPAVTSAALAVSPAAAAASLRTTAGPAAPVPVSAAAVSGASRTR